MKRSAHGANQTGIECRTLTLDDVKTFPRIPSGYESDRVFRVAREIDEEQLHWHLREERLPRPLSKTYDNGDVDDWLGSYEESAGSRALRFIGAFAGSELVGLATWTVLNWNNTVWLADIRVRQARRRLGVGSHLMAVVKLEAVRARVRGIRVETQTTNYPAIQFYRRHGFEPSGLDDHLYSNREGASQEIALFLFWER